jgi:hypothetical protein
MRAIRISEVTFENRYEVNFQKNKLLLILINAASFILFILFYLLFYYSAYYFGIIKSEDIFYFFRTIGYLPLTGSLLFIFSLVFMLFFHEVIHGIFFYIFTGTRPVIGFKSVYAYAGAPDWYIRKNYFLIITLSPVVIITLAGFVLMLFLKPPLLSLVFLLVTANAAGSAGDIWMSILLMKKPSESYVNDSGIASVICY